jgi:hypothetical protein
VTVGRSLLALAALVLAAGCSAQPAAQVRIAGEEGTRIGAAFSFVPHGQPYSFGAITLCLTQPATATITSVSLHGATGGLKADAFAIRPLTPGTSLLGNAPGTLADTGFPAYPSRAMTGACASAGASDAAAAAASPAGEGDVFEMAVQLDWSSGETATASGIDIGYTVGGISGSSTIPWAVGVCEGKCPEGLLK